MLSDIRLWFRRLWATWFPEKPVTGGALVRKVYDRPRHSHPAAERRRHERGNVLLYLGKRRGHFTPTW